MSINVCNFSYSSRFLLIISPVLQLNTYTNILYHQSSLCLKYIYCRPATVTEAFTYRDLRQNSSQYLCVFMPEPVSWLGRRKSKFGTVCAIAVCSGAISICEFSRTVVVKCALSTSLRN